MTGKTHRRFWKAFDALPPGIQKLAREKYALWKRDPYHPSLQFEERRNGICVARIGDHYLLCRGGSLRSRCRLSSPQSSASGGTSCGQSRLYTCGYGSFFLGALAAEVSLWRKISGGILE